MVTVAVRLLAGATGEAGETTGVEVVVETDILLTVFLVLVVTVLVSVIVGLVVGVLVGIFTTGILALGTVRKGLFNIVKVEVSVSTALIAISDGSVAIIVAVVTAVIVGVSSLVVDNIVVVSLGVSLGDIDVLVVLGDSVRGLNSLLSAV